jgi:bacteriocin-like protein
VTIVNDGIREVTAEIRELTEEEMSEVYGGGMASEFWHYMTDAKGYWSMLTGNDGGGSPKSTAAPC